MSYLPTYKLFMKFFNSHYFTCFCAFDNVPTYILIIIIEVRNLINLDIVKLI